MELSEKQVATEAQRSVLRQLAEAVAKPGCRFLEVGSWCGDSSVVLAEVAKENGGVLYCVDWWKGNVGTQLYSIAANQDVFGSFWNRMCAEGLDDVVVPIICSSDLAASVLKDNCFDFIFIDADHRYEGVTSDVTLFSKLVNRDGGILCGHDCEGYITDYDVEFLEKNKDVDYHETVHCGVVLAVGTYLSRYSINHSIWSVRFSEKSSSWEPTEMIFAGIDERIQVRPPPIGFMKNHNVFRYGKLIYAVPHSLGDFDVSDSGARDQLKDCPAAKTIDEIEALMGEELIPADQVPVLLETYRGFNLVQYNNCIYGMAVELGHLDMMKMDEESLKEFQETGKCVVAGTFYDTKQLVDRAISGRHRKEVSRA